MGTRVIRSSSSSSQVRSTDRDLPETSAALQDAVMLNLNRRTTAVCQNFLVGLHRHAATSSHIYFRYQSFSTALPSYSSQTSGPHDVEVRDTLLKLIDRTSRPPTGWKHTPSLRGEERRLTASIVKPTAQGRTLSIEKMSYNTREPLNIDPDAEEEAYDGSISPGTFIETRR